MRRIVAAIGLCSAGLAAWPVVLDSSSARPHAGNATFFIAAGDGYGIAECLGAGDDCGRVLADSWCAANGFARASYFGPALREGITDLSSTPIRADARLTITCED